MHVVVVGGGIGGLATAWRLRQTGVERITVCEAGGVWGGVTRSVRRDGWLFEEGPDSILSAKPAGIALLRELGLEDELVGVQPAARRACIVRGRRLLPVPEGLYLMAPGRWLPFLCSPLISWRGKLRMALDLLPPRRDPDAEEESLAAFVRRRLGREALERIAQPMVGGIYTADPERLSLAATMPQFPAMERDDRSLLWAMRKRSKAQRAAGGVGGPRYGLFCTHAQGMQRIVERLVEELDGCDLRLAAPVRAVRRRDDSWWVTLDDAAIDADAVVLALPAHAAAELLVEADAQLGDELRAIPYAGVATLNLGYRRDQIARLPDAAGFVVPEIEHRLILACTICSSKYPDRAPDGRVLLRAFIGGAMHEDELDRDDDALLAAAHAELGELIGISGEPEVAHLRRWPRAMAQHVLGHRDRLQRIREREVALPGLALVGNGYDGVGIPDLAAQADGAAERLLARETAAQHEQ